MRDWLLHLKQEDQEWVDYERHLYYPLYLSTYAGVIRNIFFRVLREREMNLASEGEFAYISQKDTSNIISFVGPRGSGKTTAMHEFCQILGKMNRQEEQNWWVNQTMPEAELRDKIMGQQFYFRILRPIDASRLEQKEDLFDIIMANIHREFRRMQKECNGERFFSPNGSDEEKWIINRFEQILQNYHAVKNARKEDFGDSSIAKMEYMSGSMDIREELDDLVEKLLAKWMELEKKNTFGNSRVNKGTANFLVIAIDDLDLNVSGGYEMLNLLYKYFSNSNIILAIAVDNDQINRICQMHYLKEFVQDMNITDGSGDLVDGLVEQCRKLARDYITKMLPADNRFFMPELNAATRQLVIGMGKEATFAKYFILKKIARHMKIFYDSKGVKIHFSEQASVREMVMYNQFLDSLYEIDFKLLFGTKTSKEHKRKLMWYYDQNHEKFNADIIGRMVQHSLDDSDRKVFEELYKKELSRRAFYFCAMAKPRIENKEVKLEMTGDYSEREYTYAAFLECIYKLGRVSARDKEFIKCVLASFTSEMVREYICCSCHGSREIRDKAMNRLHKFLGRTFGGRWLSHIVPMLDGAVEVAYGDRLDMHWATLEFEFPAEELLQELLSSEITSAKRADDLLKKLEQWLDEEKIIPTLECIFTFFVEREGENPIQNRRGFDVFIGKQQWQGSRMYLTVSGREMPVCLDIFSFVKETLHYEENYKSMQAALVRAFYEGIMRFLRERREVPLKHFDGEQESLRQALERMIGRLSIHQKLKWKYSKETAFPFYDVDLSYNVIKRIYKKYDRPSESMKQEECYKYIREIYQEIETVLREQEYTEAEDVYEYDKIFGSCPFIKAFLNYEKYLNRNFPILFGRCISEAQRLVRLDPDFDTLD